MVRKLAISGIVALVRVRVWSRLALLGSDLDSFLLDYPWLAHGLACPWLALCLALQVNVDEASEDQKPLRSFGMPFGLPFELLSAAPSGPRPWDRKALPSPACNACMANV
jgi:hypothetical protein